MTVDLQSLLSLEPGRTDALDWFIGSCLYDGGIWQSPRTSDGIHSIRVLEHASDELRVCGRIWEIDQSLHTFWLELKRDGDGDRFAWFLYFDVIETSARRARNAHDSHDKPEDVEWRAKVVGEATIQGDKLTIVPSSTRVLVQDMPDPEPAEQEERHRPRSRTKRSRR